MKVCFVYVLCFLVDILPSFQEPIAQFRKKHGTLLKKNICIKSEFGSVIQENDVESCFFCINSIGHFVQQNKTTCAILKKGIYNDCEGF